METLKLQVNWRTGDEGGQQCAHAFSLGFLACALPRVSRAVLRVDGDEFECLGFEECARGLNHAGWGSLDLQMDPDSTAADAVCVLLPPQSNGGTASVGVELRQWPFLHASPISFSPPNLEVDVWQPVPEHLPPVPFLTFFRRARHYHLASVNSLVELARGCGSLESAELLLSAEGQAPKLLYRWFADEKPNSQALRPSAVPGLYVESEEGIGGGDAEALFLEVGEERVDWGVPRDLPDLPRVEARLLGRSSEATLTPECVAEALSECDGGLPPVRVVPIADCPRTEFLIPAPPDGLSAVLAPEDGAVVAAVDFSLPAEQLVPLVLHAVGHIALGHVVAGDEYGHWDTVESVAPRDGLRRWDRDVQNAFPEVFLKGRRRVESLDECVPKEKAILGLSDMVGRMLGGRGRLHPTAEKYQQAAYQRQAAQRLLSMLDAYGGGMLCDGVGLGKTYVATTLIVHYCNDWRETSTDDLEAALADPFRIAVVAPNAIVGTWQREALLPLAAHGVPPAWVRVVSHSKLSKITCNSAVLEPGARGELSDWEHLVLSDLVVVDEAHNFRTISARRTVVLRDLLRLQPRKELRRRVLLLTATPVNNSLADLEQEVSLLFSNALPLSDARTEAGYRRQADQEVRRRADRARRHKSSSRELTPLLVHGHEEARFSQASCFRTDLRFGEIFDLAKYLKDQDAKLQDMQERIRAEAATGTPSEKTSTVRIAAELLDRIVVQRSRALCKQIEQQENSGVELLFRPDAADPEPLRYADEYDGTDEVLRRFLPLFDKSGEWELGESHPTALSFKIYMWYDVRMGFKEPEDRSPAVGLQKVLALKRLESSPVSFLISLLRLTVLHAHRLEQLHRLCSRTGREDRAQQLREGMQALLTRHPHDSLAMVRWLSVGEPFSDPIEGFFPEMSVGYVSARPAFREDDVPDQLTFFEALGAEEEKTPEEEELERLWPLGQILLRDLHRLLSVTPDLAEIVFSRFERSSWPRSFIAHNRERKWPGSPEWGMRLCTDPKLRALVRRVAAARAEGKKVIVFSQFSDTVGYIESVLRACSSLCEEDKSALMELLDVPGAGAQDLDTLIRESGTVTGDSEDRDTVINSFSPYYRIGPVAPRDGGTAARLRNEWEEAWTQASLHPVNLLLATDVLAEGVNLQDVAVLVNFDVHWNPVRMIQRSGRIDRRLNPRIEAQPDFPDLDQLAKARNLETPRYYWLGRRDASPATVNLILPDELEDELALRERIADKTLAIDFTLGLERGTGAEADWMQSYKYHGVSGLNVFERDRAIERLASCRNLLNAFLDERGIEPGWIEDLNVWLRESGTQAGAPVLGRGLIGREGGQPGLFSRFLRPRIHNGVPHWMWTVQFPSGTLASSLWLRLDGERFPPLVERALPPDPQASVPLAPEHLLVAAERVLEPATAVEELPAAQVSTTVYQGITALSAGFFGDDDDRESIDCDQVFLLQLGDRGQ